MMTILLMPTERIAVISRSCCSLLRINSVANNPENGKIMIIQSGIASTVRSRKSIMFAPLLTINSIIRKAWESQTIPISEKVLISSQTSI